MNRRDLLRAATVAGTLPGFLTDDARAQPAPALPKRPRAIAMWDFSWLERRWPGAGYEDWDAALDELADRGYDAVRIDAYPHLVAAGPQRRWLLKPVWDTQDWGAPAYVEVQVMPALVQFMQKCRDRGIKVALSTWYRQDRTDARQSVRSPQGMADVWSKTLDALAQAGLLDQVLYVDLCNEWPGALWSPIQLPGDADWTDSRALAWMRTAIGALQSKYPAIPLLFSTNNDRVEAFAEQDLGFMDLIEHHLWMTGENDDEFYKRVGYTYQRFSQAGYHNLQLHGARVYAEKPAYWQKLLTRKIARLADAARLARRPLITTECWAIVDYKDWPLLPWDWVKSVCAMGTRTASATGQWAALATSNFCGPQFRGMWQDRDWHRELTTAIKSGAIDESARTGRLWSRL